jgi:serine/threonine protein kinase
MIVIADRYELGALVGTGSSAVVHRAWDRERGTAVAVKLTVDVGVHDPRRHRREIDALTRVRHPGLVALHDGGVDDGVPYLVLDLVDGPTLAERILLGGPLTADATRRLGARVAAALAAVHAAGIVHRDVKPANVLLEPDGTPRLTDFGIARALDATAVTRTGAVLGTAGFLAPEQVRGHEVTGAADVYALGLVLLEAVTGRREYPGPAVESATARLYRSPVVPRDLPAPLARALRSMTTADPARRPTAAAAAVLLAAEPATSTIPVWRRAAVAHRPLLVAAAAVAVLTGAVGSVLLGGPSPAVPAVPAVVIPVPQPAPAAQEPPPASGTDARSAAMVVAAEAVPAPAPAAADVAEGRDDESADDGRSERRGKPDKDKPGRSGGDGGHGRGRN